MALPYGRDVYEVPNVEVGAGVVIALAKGIDDKRAIAVAKIAKRIFPL